MPLAKTSIPFEKTSQFGKLFLDYVNGKLKDYHSYEPNLAGIKKFTEENKYAGLNRALLVEELKKQNAALKLSDLSKKNIQSLLHSNTYTICTGHQLCLATGPLYFIYKILSAINLSKELNKKSGDKKFVPVYWMATEDHDVEEINHANLFNKKFTWSTNQKGRVGEFALDTIDSFLNEIADVLGENENARRILQLLKTAYSQKNLAEATRYLVNELVGQYGLLILDGNSKALKQTFISEIEKDVFDNFAFKEVNNTIEKLKEQGYEAQVNPREINCFYADEGFRERIVAENGKYKVLNTDLVFSKEELQNKIKNETEKFSPNVVLRPLYQQKIMPNAAYVGGPGEIGYWLDYGAMFKKANIPYPAIVPRGFVMYIEKGLQQRIEKLDLKIEDLFGDKNQLIKNYALKQRPFDLEKEKETLRKEFLSIRAQISEIDKTLEAATDAELQKNLKSLEALEQKVIRAIKQKSESSINQIETIYGRLFPNNVPQERVENFLRFYLGNPSFIEEVRIAIAGSQDELQVLTES